ncbi:MAG: hypothetical protein QGG42_19635 [Phycisphaerae bacterium]|jgi:hypothetical protein|nr:hypothetical protein [Phycisphaerae bacterium]
MVKSSGVFVFLSLSIILVCLSATVSCDRGGQTPDVETPAHTVGPGGGTITIDEPGSAIHGMTIKIPKGAYGTEKSFTVTHRPYPGKKSEKITPLTPLIRVDNGGDFADEIMTVTIPVDVPKGMFAMGFFVDKEGELEPMPLIDLTPKSVTVATRHFSEFFVSAISEMLLAGKIDTKFRPGYDDWQFDNYGSYIEPGGHCAGMTTAAGWYYFEKKRKGEAKLNGRYDNNGGDATPKFWYDDSLACRFVSTVQKDLNFKSLIHKVFEAYSDTSAALTWKVFLYSMYVTGEPQEVGVYDTDKGGGHALMVYAADVDKGVLRVADPNYKGDRARGIFFLNGKFVPYNSGANYAEIQKGNTTSYESILFNARTALVPWKKIGERWAELEKGTVGNDRFPKYKLLCSSKSDKEAELVDGMEITGEALKITIKSKKNLGFSVRKNNAWTSTYCAAITTHFKKVGDKQLIGFYVTGKHKFENKKVVSGEYVDFKWINITRVAKTDDNTPPERKVNTSPGVVVNGVFYGQLKTNTRREGMMLFIVDAKEKIVLRTAARILSEKKDSFGNVTETTFRFQRGLGSPAIPPGQWKVCAGPTVGQWRARSKVFTAGESGNVSVTVGSPPPPDP